MTMTAKKVEVMKAARRFGWRGQSYEKAARFMQARERRLHPPVVAAPGKGTHSARRIAPPPKVVVPRYKPPGTQTGARPRSASVAAMLAASAALAPRE